MGMLKHRGDIGIGAMIGMIITLFISLILIMSYTSWHTKLAVKDSIVLTVNSYLKAVETAGYFTDELQGALEEELNQYGLENISFAGSSLSPVQYGGKVYLHVSGKLHLTETPSLVIENGRIQFTKESYMNVELIRKGISFY